MMAKKESYESRLDLGGFGWFVLLPKGKYGTCLGLLDKFVGFTAVESIFENDSTQTVVVKESGTLGWLSEKEPQKDRNCDRSFRLQSGQCAVRDKCTASGNCQNGSRYKRGDRRI
jgi:hypothetical protein